LDVTHAFGAGGIPGEDWWATPYDGHANEAAHAIVAEHVARFVADPDVMVDLLARYGQLSATGAQKPAP
jgi:hypothetical protein